MSEISFEVGPCAHGFNGEFLCKYVCHICNGEFLYKYQSLRNQQNRRKVKGNPLDFEISSYLQR